MRINTMARSGPITTIKGTEGIELVGTRRSVILFFHGYSGFPAELLPTATAMQQQGYTVVIPRLIGHGSSIQAFCATTADDWLAQAIHLYFHWQDLGYRVIPAGLSMGGLIACWLAAMQQCDRLIMLAPALTLRDRRVLVSPFLRGILPSVPCKGNQYDHRGTFGSPAENETKREVDAVYHTHHLLAPLSQLLRMTQHGLAALKKIRAQTFVALSDDDQTIISERVSRIVVQRLPPKLLQLHTIPQSKHVLTRAKYQPRLLPPLLAWLKATETETVGTKTT